MVEESGSIVEATFQEIVESSPVFDFKGEGPKRLLIMSGLPLSGKTYFVNHLNKRKPGRFQQINSHDTRPIVVKHLGRKRPKYDKTEHQLTFEVTSKLVEKVLNNDWPVIADATNLKEKYRAWAVEAGRKADAEMMTVFMQVTDEIAQQRISERTTKSSATYETYQQLKYELEPVSRCTVPYIVIDSGVDISPYINNVVRWLSGEIDSMPNVIQPRV